MKKSLFAFAFVLSSSAFAIVPSHYQVNYEVTDVRSLCPINAICTKFSVEVKATASLAGCFDKVVYADFKVVKKHGKATIHATGIAKVDPRSASARCFRAQTDTRKITISDESYFEVEIINQDVQF